MEKYIEKATFSEIYKFVNGDGKEELLKCFTGLFKTGLIFLPRLLCPETALITDIGNGVNLFGAAEAIEAGIKGVYDYFKGRHYTDYRTRYDEMQVAHYMITFAAFFDTIKEYLPDESGKIKLAGNEKLHIANEAVTKYIESLKKENITTKNTWINTEVVLPNPLSSFDSYLKMLSGFYDFFSKEFLVFFEKLSIWEDMNEFSKDIVMARMNHLSTNAVENYKKQYYELSRCFKDFELWATQQERQALKHEIDIGFERIDKNMSAMLEYSNNTIVDILEREYRLYSDFVKTPIIEDEADIYCEDEIFLPSKCKIFIPQKFKAIRYKDNIKLEPKETWKDANEQDNISEFISAMLRHPNCSTKPLVILGLPGAGKSLLCNMLASKILHNEYHVIIVKLRDACADDDITKQITNQIKGDLGADCSWYDISSAKLNKPLLVIFDGYDELLQSSGKTYSSYINNIAQFQRTQLITCDLQVRCIVTSRTVLIDKAHIPTETTILKLCDFDDDRINAWCDIWNDCNKTYFEENNLNEFSLPDNSKVKELAGQPLLLMMLALYDANGNKLKKQQDLTLTQLYDSLINVFISREKNKEDEFRNITNDKKAKKIEIEIIKVGITAIGMYNRNAYHIVTDDLNSDLEFYKNIFEIDDFRSFTEDGITEGESLLGRFLFVYKSRSTNYENKDKKTNAAYEFLHNTFGEFLAADFILKNVYIAVDEVKSKVDSNKRINWNGVFLDSWYASLIYIPLFSKPVVVSMLKEWSCILFERFGIEKSSLKEIADTILNYEINQIFNGMIFKTLNEIRAKKVYPEHDLLTHAAIYSINLLIIRNIITSDMARINLLEPLKQDTLDKLINLWKYAFDDDDFLRLSHLFKISKDNTDNQNIIVIKYTPNSFISEDRNNRLENLYDISYSIGDQLMQALTGCLIGNGSKITAIGNTFEVCNLKLKSQCDFNTIVNSIFTSKPKNLKKIFSRFLNDALEDKNINYVYICCVLLELFIEKGILFLNNETDCDYLIEKICIILEFCDDKRIWISITKYNSNSLYLYILDYICKILLNSKIPDQLYIYFFESTILSRWITDFNYISLSVLKCINKYLSLHKNSNKKNFGYFLHSTSAPDGLMYYISSKSSQYAKSNNNFLYVINEFLKLYLNLIDKKTAYSRRILEWILSDEIILSVFIRQFKDINLITEICSNLIKSIFAYIEHSNKMHKDVLIYKTTGIIVKLLYFVKIEYLYNYSEDAVYKLLYILNNDKLDEITDSETILKQIINLIDSKQETISIRVAKELSKLGEIYSCSELIEKVKKLLEY